MQLHTVLVRAFADTAAVVRGVRPEQLGAATPCADWNVRALTNHVLQVGFALRLAGRRAPLPDDLWTQDLIGADGPADRFEDDRRDALEAWSEPAAWEGKVDLGAPMTTFEAVTMLASDLAIHAWDLAQATGQEYRCDPTVAAVVRKFLTTSGEQGRQMGIFGPALPIPAGASAFEEALALSGRAQP
jgi:uncharacterized protein (TIGR03086 family)